MVIMQRQIKLTRNIKSSTNLTPTPMATPTPIEQANNTEHNKQLPLHNTLVCIAHNISLVVQLCLERLRGLLRHLAEVGLLLLLLQIFVDVFLLELRLLDCYVVRRGGGASKERPRKARYQRGP